MTTHDEVARAIACGDTLDADARAHADACPTCGSLLDARARLVGAISTPRHEPPPGLHARLVAGAHARRARRRWVAAGLAAAEVAAVGAFAVVLAAHAGPPPRASRVPAPVETAGGPPSRAPDDVRPASREAGGPRPTGGVSGPAEAASSPTAAASWPAAAASWFTQGASWLAGGADAARARHPEVRQLLWYGDVDAALAPSGAWDVVEEPFVEVRAIAAGLRRRASKGGAR